MELFQLPHRRKNLRKFKKAKINGIDDLFKRAKNIIFWKESII